MNHLQKDIDSLESERHHLRENLKAHSTKKGDTKQPITFGITNFFLENSEGFFRISFIFEKATDLLKQMFFLNFVDTTASTPFVAQELTILKKALHNERSERIKVQAAEMEKILKNLAPIHVPQPKDNRINDLEKDLMKVKHVSYFIEISSSIRYCLIK